MTILAETRVGLSVDRPTLPCKVELAAGSDTGGAEEASGEPARGPPKATTKPPSTKAS